MGKLGDTGKRYLIKGTGEKAEFQLGNTDTFHLDGLDVGQLQHLVLGHDTRGRGRGWYCEQVKVQVTEKDQKPATETIFPCHR